MDSRRSVATISSGREVREGLHSSGRIFSGVSASSILPSTELSGSSVKTTPEMLPLLTVIFRSVERKESI